MSATKEQGRLNRYWANDVRNVALPPEKRRRAPRWLLIMWLAVFGMIAGQGVYWVCVWARM
jgi:hypothetical protein